MQRLKNHHPPAVEDKNFDFYTNTQRFYSLSIANAVVQSLLGTSIVQMVVFNIFFKEKYLYYEKRTRRR